MNMNDFTDEDFSSLLSAMEEDEAKDKFASLYWKPAKEGVYKLRILTPLKQFGEKLFFVKHKIHYIDGVPYFCLSQTLKDKNGVEHAAEACPICAKSKQLYNGAVRDSEEWKLAGKLRAKDRYVSRVVVRGKTNADGENAEAYPEFWEFGKKIHDYFMEAVRLGECGNFLSLKDGRDFNFSKKGSGINTDYSSSALAMKTSPIFDEANIDKLKTLIEQLPLMEYSKLVEFRSPEELKRICDEWLTGGAKDPAQEKPQTPVEEETAPIEAPVEKEEAAGQNIDDLLKLI